MFASNQYQSLIVLQLQVYREKKMYITIHGNRGKDHHLPSLQLKSFEDAINNLLSSEVKNKIK